MTNNEPSETRWRVAATLGPVLALALLPGPVLLAWNSLPDALAMSWRDGVAVNLRTPGTLLAFQALFAVICSALFLVGGLRKLGGDSFNVAAILMAAVLTAIFAVQSLTTVLANVDQVTGADVAEPGWVWTAVTIAAPLVALVVIGLVFRDAVVGSPPIVEPAPTAGLALGNSEVAAWHSTAVAPWSQALIFGAWLVPVAIVVAAIFIDASFWVMLLPIVLVVVAVTAFARIGVSVDRRGLTVRYGWLPWPRTHISLDSILSAAAADVRPSEQGGWGYRGSRALLGRAAVVVRAGEGMHLRLVNDREFVVTIDHAAHGAGVLNDLLAANHPVAAS